jgi:hypothetical protein
MSISTPLARCRCTERNVDAVPTVCVGEWSKAARFALQSERQLRDDRHSIGASLGEPAHEHGPGFVGDIGERSDAHPVGEIESNSTFPMALPFVDYFGANDGNASAR